MTSEPLVTVLLPVRNGEAFIARAIASLREQTYPHVEILVLDDGSTDGTRQVVMERFEPFVEYVALPPQGIAATLNVGLARARGSIIARQDADDESHPDRITQQVAFFDRQPSAVVVGVDWREIGEDGVERVHRRPYRAGDVTQSLISWNPIFHGAVAFRTGPAREVGGYDRSMVLAQDYDLWLRLAEAGPVWNLSARLATRHMTGSNIAGTREREQHLFALRARSRAIRRRRDLAAARFLLAPACRLLVPLSIKRWIRTQRGQAR